MNLWTKCVVRVVSAIGVVVLIAAARSAHGAPDTPKYTYYSSGGTITIPPLGLASAYPSGISLVTGDSNLRTVEKITVTLHGFTHNKPSDVRVLLSHGTTGTSSVLLMHRAGGTLPVTNATITFDAAAASPLPQTGTFSSGTYQPSVYGTVSGMSSPAPTPPYALLSGLSGYPVQGDWSLWVEDETSVNGGSLAAWSITIEPGDAQGSAIYYTDFLVPAGAPTTTSGLAAEYPSQILASGVEGPITEVTAFVYFTHQSPIDLDVMLVSPDGRGVVLCSDVGGNALRAYQWTFKDAAPFGSVPAGFALSPGIYRPTNTSTSDAFAHPASNNIGTAMSHFNGGTPNGTWSLFVVDDSAVANSAGTASTGTITTWAVYVNGKTFCAGDHNKSGEITVQDIFDYLEAFFSGCP